jgi:hypothetical protein
MTRNYHDLFAKQHLEALLETVGKVTSSRKIVSETREVDIHQLSVNDATLWLRLMGRDGVQRKAIAELLNLPAQHPMKRKTMEHLAVLQISLSMGQNLDIDERAIAMNLTPLY